MNMKTSCIYKRKSELYNVLINNNSLIGHGGRRLMIKELSNEYKNIARVVVELFSNLFKPCR